MPETEVVPHEEKAAVPATTEQGPMGIMMAAMAQGADVDQLERMMALQERWDANEAKKAYVAAMAKFKANPPKIVKTKKVSFNATKYSHASLGEITDLIGAGLGEVGISASWNQEQLDKGMIKVICTLTHEMGHSESTHLVSGADTTGSKNSIQAIGSTITYLQRYTLLAITGLAAQDQDDDGVNAEPERLISESQVSQLVDMMNAAGVDHTDFLKYYSNLAKTPIETADKMPESMFAPAMGDLKKITEGDK